MKVGAIFPQTECGADIGAIAEFVRAIEAMGFDHLFVADLHRVLEYTSSP